MPRHPSALPLAALLACGTLVPAQQWTFLDGPGPYTHGAYDWLRERLVLFGSDGGTWELDGTRLLQRPVAGPPPRRDAVLVYDLARRHVLLFGGAGVSGPLLGDTWSWDGFRWTQLANGMAPAARFGASAAYDLARERIVLFGGSAGGQPFVDTWEHDGALWTLRQPATTPPAHSALASFDVARAVTVLTLGSPGGAQTWEWNGIDWLPRQVAGPTDMIGASMAYDLGRMRTVLIGGRGQDVRVWEWDGTAWRENPQSSPRRFAPVVYHDPGRGRLAVFGGSASSQHVDFALDSLEWDGSVLRQVMARARPATEDALLVASDTRGEVLLFGGRRGAPAHRTWTWNGESWREHQPVTSPPARAMAAGCHDDARGLALMFGGMTVAFAPMADLWGWNGTDWRLLAPTGPPPRKHAGFAFDRARGVAVLFGGSSLPSSGLQLFDDTWEWDGTAWQQRPLPSYRPLAREQCAMTFDATRNRVVMFGGLHGVPAAWLRDFWAWDGAAWTPLALGGIDALIEPSASFDAATQRVLIAGTNYGSSGVRREIWSVAGAVATLVHSSPRALLGRDLVQDPRRQRLLDWDGAMLAEFSTTPAQIAVVGAGCGGPVPRLLAHARPRIGEGGFGLEADVGAGALVLFAIADAAGSVSLAPGCTLHLGGTAALLAAAPSRTGHAEMWLPLPLDPRLRGVDAFAQAAVLDPAASPGFRLTQALQFTLGD